MRSKTQQLILLVICITCAYSGEVKINDPEKVRIAISERFPENAPEKTAVVSYKIAGLIDVVRAERLLRSPASFKYFIYSNESIVDLIPEVLLLQCKKFDLSYKDVEQDIEKLAPMIFNTSEKIVGISSLDKIPGYSQRPLDSDLSSTVRSPFVLNDEQRHLIKNISYWYSRQSGSLYRLVVEEASEKIVGIRYSLLATEIGDFRRIE